MKKSSATLIGLVTAAAIAFAFAWPYASMEFASSAYYTEQDKRQYDYYTPDLFIKMPRISSHYDFGFGRIVGTEANVFTVNFYGVTDVSRIEDYLTSEGYKRQATYDVEAQCWKSPATKDVITLGNLNSQKAVFVQIYRRL